MDTKWILLVLVILLITGLGYYTYSNMVNLEFDTFYGEIVTHSVEYTNGNTFSSKGFAVNLNQINSKETYKELQGNCFAYDESGNVLSKKNIVWVDCDNEGYYELQFTNEDDIDKVSKIEIVFYDDNDHELYHNSTTNITRNDTKDTGVTVPNSEEYDSHKGSYSLPECLAIAGEGKKVKSISDMGNEYRFEIDSSIPGHKYLYVDKNTGKKHWSSK